MHRCQVSPWPHPNYPLHSYGFLHVQSLYYSADRREYETQLTLDGSLAYANIYHVLAALFRRFDLELVDTIRERDVDMARDVFASKPRRESKGVCVRVVGEAST